jgi:hypothetical protein
MSLIRTHTIEGNQSGRGGCVLWSPTTNAIYYVTIEHGTVVARNYAKEDIGHDGPSTVADPKVTACFAYPGMAVVCVAGFDPNTSNSRMETWMFPVKEG